MRGNLDAITDFAHQISLESESLRCKHIQSPDETFHVPSKPQVSGGQLQWASDAVIPSLALS